MLERIINEKNLKLVDRPEWEVPERLDLESGRRVIAEWMAKIFSSPKPLIYIFNEPPGFGKTTIALSALRAISETAWPLRSGGTDIRVLILTKTNQAIEEVQKQLPGATYVRGRIDDPESSYYCERTDEVTALASKHQSPIDTGYCHQCIKQNMRLDPSWKCRYLDTIRQATKARMVVAPYASYLNQGDRIDDFDIIIFDEEMPSQLARSVSISHDALDTWIEAMDAFNQAGNQSEAVYPENHPACLLINACKRLMVRSKNEDVYSAVFDGQDPMLAIEVRPLAESLSDELRDRAETVFQYLRSVAAKEETDQAFEKPVGSRVPLRVFKELAIAILENKGAIQIKKGELQLTYPLRHVLGQLRNKTVINLDATPNMELLLDMFGPEKIRVTRRRPPDLNIRVTQFPSYVYLPRFWRCSEDRLLREIETLIGYCISDFQRPLIVAPKEFVQPSRKRFGEKRLLQVDHPGAKVIYFGNETRALNAFSDRDCVVIVGHWQENLDSIRRRVAALRSSNTSPRFKATEYEALLEENGLVYEPYFQPSNLDNQVLARKRLGMDNLDCEQDWLVLAATAHSLASEAIQAIGRARPLQRETPLDVFIINGAVYQGVPISEFVFRSEILGNLRARPNLLEIRAARVSENERLCRTAFDAGYTTVRGAKNYLLEKHGVTLSNPTIRKYLRMINETA